MGGGAKRGRRWETEHPEEYASPLHLACYVILFQSVNCGAGGILLTAGDPGRHCWEGSLTKPPYYGSMRYATGKD